MRNGSDSKSHRRLTPGDSEWRCEVCRVIRPRAKISVQKHSLDLGVPGSYDMYYCNDNPDCVEKSKVPPDWIVKLGEKDE